MDEYTRALFELKGEVGGLIQAVKDQGREIGDIKKLLESRTVECSRCRTGIDQALDAQAEVFTNRLDAQDAKIKPLENLHTGEKAVRSWQDRTLGEIATSIGAGAGIIALLAYVVRGALTGDWY